jgi:hypothetical protein
MIASQRPRTSVTTEPIFCKQVHGIRLALNQPVHFTYLTHTYHETYPPRSARLPCDPTPVSTKLYPHNHTHTKRVPAPLARNSNGHEPSPPTKTQTHMQSLTQSKEKVCVQGCVSRGMAYTLYHVRSIRKSRPRNST